MKYKAYKEKNKNTWFVNLRKVNGVQRGKRFNNELEAKQFAIIQSFNYHLTSMDNAFSELSKISEKNDNGEIKPIGYECFGTQSDFMC